MKSLTEYLELQSYPVSRTQFFWCMAVTCQILFWYIAQPGPQLSDGYIGSLQTGIDSSLWSALFLLVIPLCYWVVNGSSIKSLGLGIGDWKFGLISLAVLGPIVALLLMLGSSDPSVQDFYPIVGTQLTGSEWVVWFLWYSLFYVAFEFFYRGILLQGPEDWPEPTRISVAVVCCTLIHVGKPLIEALASLPASVLFVYLALRTKSIWYGFLLHWLIGIVNDLSMAWQQQ